MKKCVNCGIDIGGDGRTCPLCQNAITGIATPYNWPPMKKLKKQAFFYKLQLFLMLTAVVIGLSLDFLLDLYDKKHWSIILAITVVSVELLVRGFIKKTPVLAKIISMSVLHVSVLLVIIGWYYEFLNPIIYIVIPILVGANLVVNLILALIDKTENAMVYLLVNILVGVVSYVVLLIGRKSRTLPWTICLMISAVTLIGIMVFKGRKVISEIQKRMNF